MQHRTKGIVTRLFTALILLSGYTTAGAMTLSIDDGTTTGIGFYEGSYICLPISPGFDCRITLSGNDGIRIGDTQPAAGSHFGPPDGSEVPGIDLPFEFFNRTGMHLTTSDVDLISHSGNIMTLDFSGWSMIFGEFGLIPLGTGAWYTGATDGIAEVVCGLDCSAGDSYVLDYSATVPSGHPSGFGDVQYYVHLEGTISAIPIPAAIWLFASGLLFVASWRKAR